MSNQSRTMAEIEHWLKLFGAIGAVVFSVGFWIDIVTLLAVFWQETLMNAGRPEDADSYYKLGNQLLVVGIFIIAVVVTATSAIIVDEGKQARREGREVRPGDSSGGTPIFSEEAEYEAEGKKLRRTQELMNLDDFGIQLPPKRPRC